MLSLSLDRVEFAARRRVAQTTLEEELAAAVAESIEANDWGDLLDAAEEAFRASYLEESGAPYAGSMTAWRRRLRSTLAKGSYDNVPSREQTALWVATYVLNTAAVEAAANDPEDVDLEWVTMHDKAVREAHAEVDGQVRPPSVPFDVDGVEMTGPGDITAPPELWLGCRCALRPTLRTDTFALGGTMEDTTETPARRPDGLGVPWYGPLTAEGVWTGDKRRFEADSVTWQQEPGVMSPLTWQKFSADGHDQNVTVARIEEVYRYDGKVWGAGHSLLTVPEADEWVGLLAEFGKFGVSIDADSTTFSVDEEEGGISYSMARGRSACTVAIPAFNESWVTLGELPDEVRKKGKRLDVPDDLEDDDEGEREPEDEVPEEEMLRPDAPTDEDGAPIEPEDREDDKRKPPRPKMSPLEQIRMAAQALGEFRDVPTEERKDLAGAADVAEFVDIAPGRTEDGPGWLTNPVDTDRIRDYWVSGPGGAKIGWGTPGDFNRCRTLVAEYVKPQHINGYCANRHFDALGVWPGPGKRGHSADTIPFAADTLQLTDRTPAPALNLVASASPGWCAPSDWFKDPQFKEGDGRVQQTKSGLGCPFTITKEGQVFGHIGLWGQCHLNSRLAGEACVSPPHSETGYSEFLNGSVLTDAGEYIPTGVISVGPGHAADGLSKKAALAHYDSAATAGADVTCGEDEFGIWVAGWVRPGTPDAMVAAMLASPPSGDWREVWTPKGWNLEMIAALSVNVPGFGIPRTRVAARNGHQVSLVASGVVALTPDEQEHLVVPDADSVPLREPASPAEALAVAVDYDRIAQGVMEKIAESAQARERIAALAAEIEEM